MSVNQTASQSAFGVLSLRALASFEEDERIKTGDSLALSFLPGERRAALADTGSRGMLKKSLPPGLYEYVIARTKFFDSLLTGQSFAGTSQVVFLGAGYDSRPYRFADILSGCRVFEVDSVPTQEHKISVIRSINIRIPENISYIAADFEKDDIIGLMLRKGYDADVQTLFILEGVSFYLTASAVTSLLYTVRRNSGPGSCIAFDFQAINSAGDIIDTGLENEQARFGIDSGKIEEFITSKGFVIAEHIKAPEMEQKYLTMRNGELFGRIMPHMNFMLARHE